MGVQRIIVRPRRAISESVPSHLQGMDEGFVGSSGVLKQIFPLDDFHENATYFRHLSE